MFAQNSKSEQNKYLLKSEVDCPVSAYSFQGFVCTCRAVQVLLCVRI